MTGPLSMYIDDNDSTMVSLWAAVLVVVMDGMPGPDSGGVNPLLKSS